MSKKAPLLDAIALNGLEIAPSQVWGAIRLVPLLRSHVRQDLRLFKRTYHEDVTLVSLEGKQVGDGLSYLSYVPHGLVLSWSDDGSPVAALGGQLMTEGKRIACGPTTVRLMHRMAKRETANSLRFLPLHLAMEGFLSMFFNGPTIAWNEYSRQALAQGLSPRVEWSVSGRAIAGLEDALRVFEIHEGQVGMLLFVSEALASAFVVPTPDDYRALHTSLLEDFYGELLYSYGCFGTTTRLETTVNAENITDLSSLKAAIAQMRDDWATFQGFMAADLLQRDLQAQRVYTAGPFTLQRFITDLSLKSENHIGEAIVREDGQLEYLKTYRLSEAQTRRVYLLSQLALNGWNLERTAAQLDNTLDEFVYRLEKAGFGYLLKTQVREKAAKQRRKAF
jgi:hypothetical protein